LFGLLSLFALSDLASWREMEGFLVLSVLCLWCDVSDLERSEAESLRETLRSSSLASAMTDRWLDLLERETDELGIGSC